MSIVYKRKTKQSRMQYL